MKWTTRTAVAALALGGCSPLSALTGAPGQAGHVEALRAIGEHMEGCDRHYQGGLGVGGSFTFTIDCKARPAAQSGPDEPVIADPR